jgi:2-amino-4-hydroxy-6-hydroxymethyldihydropteridine diphosphokinase
MAAVYVAAGSNVEPERHLALATELLRREFPDVRFSPWYRNRAVGFEGADFINLVAGFTTLLPVNAVLLRMYAIEVACGRPRDAPRWAPRSMDLDVLLYGELICDEPKLKLPRPDLLKRAFMLGPLAALAPELMHPTEKATIGELWRRFDRAGHELIEIEPATNPHSARHRSPGSVP